MHPIGGAVVSALEEFLLGDPTADEVDETPPVPDNIEEADWQVRRLARIRRRMAENEALAAAEIALARKWCQEENAKLERTASFFEQSLTAFHAQLLESDAKRKTVSLPGGTLKARKHPDRVDVVDADLFVRWAQAEKPELVRTKVEPDKSAIKRLLGAGPSAGERGLALVDPATGEAAPGVVLVEGETSFAVDTPDLTKEVGE